MVLATPCFGEDNVKIECFSVGCDYKDEFPKSKAPVICPKCGNKSLVEVERNQSEEDIAKAKAEKEMREKLQRDIDNSHRQYAKQNNYSSSGSAQRTNFSPRNTGNANKERKCYSKVLGALCPNCNRSFRLTQEQYEQMTYGTCPYCGGSLNVSQAVNCYNYERGLQQRQAWQNFFQGVGNTIVQTLDRQQAYRAQQRMMMQQQQYQHQQWINQMNQPGSSSGNPLYIKRSD